LSSARLTLTNKPRRQALKIFGFAFWRPSVFGVYLGRINDEGLNKSAVL
jgi:hypothetical protein